MSKRDNSNFSELTRVKERRFWLSMKILTRLESAILLFCLLVSLTTPVLAADNEVAALFPINGVILGKTTLAEVLSSEGTLTEDGATANGFFKKGSINFGYEAYTITTLAIDKDEPLPDAWKNAGFDWSLSYQSWISLLEKLGHSIRITQVPTLQMKAGYPVLESQFEAFRPSEFPTVFTFYFIGHQGTGVYSENTLYRISARYIHDFQGFPTEGTFSNGEKVNLDERKRKALALSGITAALSGLNHETLELEKINQTSISYWKKVLADEWGIKQRKQLLEKLAFIESKGDSEVFRELAGILEKRQGLTINQIAKEFDHQPEIMNRLHFVQAKHGLIGDRALRAWDFSRMAFLCRIGYQVGLISAAEAWTYLERALKKVESSYLSWEDFAANYILGMIFKASESGLEIEAGNQGLRAYTRLINSQGTAWQLTWGGQNPVTQTKGNTLEDVLYFPSPQYQAWKEYLKGWQSYQNGDLPAALKYFKSGLTLDPEFVDLWLMMAMVYNMQNDFAKAIDAFNEYLVKCPGEYLPRIYLAEVYEKGGRLQEALEEYNKAIGLDDSRPEGFTGLGRIALNSGDYQLAIDYLRIAESLSLNGDQEIYYILYLLGYSYYKWEKFDKALSYFLRVYSNYQDDMYFLYYLGVCYLYNQNTKLASAYLERAEALGLAVPPEIKTLLDQPAKP